jgi:hypothetical protein
LGIGSIVASNYYPPNYQGAFLRGAGGSSPYVGPNLKASQTDAFGSHSHTGNMPNHTHVINSHPTSWVFDGQNVSKQNNNIAMDGTWGASLETSYVNNGGLALTIAATGSAETRPYNFGVNWIIKL